MRFCVLGPLEVRSSDGELLPLGGPRPRAVLAMLLLEAGRMVPVERLIDGQYGQEPPAGAANAVQAQISRIRRNLPADLVEFHGTGYRLAVEPEDVDVHRFERLAREGRRLLAAGQPAAAAAELREGLELWRGPALADVADVPFAATQITRLEELRLDATEDLLEAELALPDASPVAGLQRLVAEHPLRERPRGLLMRALHAAGRSSEALAGYEEARKLLAEELGADPSPELRAVHLAILRGDQQRERAARPGLPTQLTSFVGRERELARLAELGQARLITITGPGGTGKTRLALEYAAARHGEACLVDLSLVDDPGQVAPAVLGALGLRESGLGPPAPSGASATERLLAALAGQELLLVLDNCEHVIDTAATLARRLLAACPGLTVLATSREPLGLTGEHLLPLQPLPLPAEPPGEAGAALAFPAVRLFADRASAVRPGFQVEPGNLAAVLRICTALEGLPLAIELAAARVRTFAVEEIAARLAEHGRFRLLSRGDRTAAARHRTLHAVVEWSWDLLDTDEQTLARRFSAFSGGARLAAIERVCGRDGADLIADLVDKSLVETDGERYQMLDTIRLFCADRLAESAEHDRVLAAHAAYVLDLAEGTEPHLFTADQLDWLALLDADEANVRAALRWTVRHDHETALRLITTLAMYWWLSGRRGQAVRPAVRLLEELGETVPAGMEEEYLVTVLHAGPEAGARCWERARAIVRERDAPPRHPFSAALWGMVAGPPEEGTEIAALGSDPWSRALERLSVGLLRTLSGEIADAEPELAAALAQFRDVGERWGTAQALDALASLAGWRGEWERSRALWDEALDLLGQLGADEEIVDVLCRQADGLWRSGSAQAAWAAAHRALELARRTGSAFSVAVAQLALAELARWQADHAQAAERYDAGLAAQAGGFTTGGLRARCFLGHARVAQTRGDLREAELRLRQALEEASGSPITSDQAAVAEGMAGLALLEGAAERAALLLGIGVALRGTTVAGDPDVAAVAGQATAAIGAEAFAAAYATGSAMTRDEALTVLGATVSR
ncbi:BTAD domain-containing putative transcriptional regulator [Nonomuraea sediminis]|uniref:BTAD domain-containing putative transcriptional regulator n=1 Tax=Nonomuraea sediminis TaxID=2835864 RepID=UPI001BDDC663|nr:BTAD domain-containing putative transcriptional regulator [Nonomuraea sediminis]